MFDDMDSGTLRDEECSGVQETKSESFKFCSMYKKLSKPNNLRAL